MPTGVPEPQSPLSELLSIRPFDGADVSILDTDRVINHLKKRVRTGRRPSRPSEDQLVRGYTYASRHVYDEMYKPYKDESRHKFDKLATQSRQEGWPTAAATFQEIFEDEYLPQITFVEVGDLYTSHETTLSVGDHHDRPTGQLVTLLAGVDRLLYSHDRTFAKAALAAPDLDVLLDAWGPVEEGNTVQQGLALSGGVSAMGVAGLTNRVADWLGVPRWAVYLAELAGTIFVMRRPERRQKVIGVLSIIGDVLSTAALAAQAAEEVLARHTIPASEELELHQAVAAVLAKQPAGVGMLAPDIRRELLDSGWYNFTDQDLRALLRAEPCFVEIRPFRFQLGRILDPRVVIDINATVSDTANIGE